MSPDLKSISSQATEDIKTLIPKLEPRELAYIEARIYNACGHAASLGISKVMDDTMKTLEGGNTSRDDAEEIRISSKKYPCSKCGVRRTPAELNVIQIYGMSQVVCAEGCTSEKKK